MNADDGRGLFQYNPPRPFPPEARDPEAQIRWGLQFLQNRWSRKVTVMKVVEIVQTCGACPSQWEGKADDGRAVYVRYRWGYLSVCRGTDEDPQDAVMGEEVFGRQLGGDYEGVLSYEDLKLRTVGHVEWPAECTGVWPS